MLHKTLLRAEFIVLCFFTMYVSCSSDDSVKMNNADPLCGPLSLLYILDQKEIPATLEEICELTGYNRKSGTNMYDLFEASEKKGLTPQAKKADLNTLCDSKSPCIIFVDGKHFMVFLRCENDDVIVTNPPDAPFMLSKKEFLKRWNGETLFFFESEDTPTSMVSTNSSGKHNGPDIEFDKTSHYFGVVDEGEVLKTRLLVSKCRRRHPENSFGEIEMRLP